MSLKCLTGKQLKRLIAAIYYIDDKRLVKLGEDPEVLRTRFYKLYSDKSRQFDEYPISGVPEEADDYLVIDFGSFGTSNITGWTGYDMWEEYMLVYKHEDVYYKVIGRASAYQSGYGLPDEPEPDEIHITGKPEKVDFVDMAVNYRAIKLLCEYFGPEEILKHIES